MKPFSAPLKDIFFSLEHIVQMHQVPHWDSTTANEIAEHFAAFAQSEIAPLDEPGDRQGCSLVNGRVVMPDGFQSVYQQYIDQGWPALSAPEKFDGQAQGPATCAISTEIFAGACHSLQMVVGLVPAAMRTLMRFGTQDQQNRYIPPLSDGTCIATMCLSEPSAGSDLSRIRCKAEPHAEQWKIHGEKIYISAGDQNLSEDTLHLVLARTSDEGVHGLSLFLCSDKFNGTRNAITVNRIENKMGLHASPTCQLEFTGAVAELIGRPGEGLRAMFTMMNHARLDVALQGVAHAARSRDIAHTYACQREQGRLPDGSPAMLIEHADVLRMIDEIDASALGGRAIAQLALKELELGRNPDLIEFLTPVIKVHCTEAASQAATLAMQVLGGYGYLSEYRLEQTYRDARICAIYEGANGVHERALSERMLRGKNAKAADAFDSFLSDQVSASESSSLHNSVRLWKEARQIVSTASKPSVLAHDFMLITIDSLLHVVWEQFAKVAHLHDETARISRVSTTQINRINAYLPATLSVMKTKVSA